MLSPFWELLNVLAWKFKPNSIWYHVWFALRIFSMLLLKILQLLIDEENFGSADRWEVTILIRGSLIWLPEKDASSEMVCTENELLGWNDFPKGLKVLLLDKDCNSASEMRSRLEQMNYIGKISFLSFC